MKFVEIEAACLAAGLEDTWPEGFGMGDLPDEMFEEFGVTIKEFDDDTKFFFPDGIELDVMKFFWKYDTSGLFCVVGNASLDRWVGFYDDPENSSLPLFLFFRTPDELKAILDTL